MPTIILKIDIDIRDYQEVVSSQGSLFEKIGSHLISDSSLRSRIDNQIEKEIKANLGSEVVKNITNELSRRGIGCVVSYQYR